MLNDHQRELVEQNHNLIYFCLKRMNLRINDYYGVAAEALCKAAMKYDPSVSKFATYAVKAITINILDSMRSEKSVKRKAYHNSVSYDELIDDESDETFARYALIDHNSDPCDALIFSELLRSISSLKEPRKTAVIMAIQGYTQTEISKKINNSQVGVCRMIQSAKRELLKAVSSER